MSLIHRTLRALARAAGALESFAHRSEHEQAIRELRRRADAHLGAIGELSSHVADLEAELRARMNGIELAFVSHANDNERHVIPCPGRWCAVCNPQPAQPK